MTVLAPLQRCSEFRLQAGLNVLGRSRLHATQTQDFKGYPDCLTRLKAELGPQSRSIAFGNPIRTAELRSCTNGTAVRKRRLGLGLGFSQFGS